MRKATRAAECRELEQIPNVGPSVAADLRRIGIRRPQQLKGADPFRLYVRLCRVSGERHDPCVWDSFIAAVRFMEGAPAQPWWYYTPARKRAQRG